MLYPFRLPDRIFANQLENAVFGTPVVDGPHWGHERELRIVSEEFPVVRWLRVLLRRSFFVFYRINLELMRVVIRI
jgi:hypothetical protein